MISWSIRFQRIANALNITSEHLLNNVQSRYPELVSLYNQLTNDEQELILETLEKVTLNRKIPTTIKD